MTDNRVINTGLVVETECPEAPDAGCVVFADSSIHALMPVLASSFRRVVFAIGVTVDYEFVRERRPDAVISIMNERLMIMIPRDTGAPTVQEQARLKTSRGLLRDRDLPYWPHSPDARPRAGQAPPRGNSGPQGNE